MEEEREAYYTPAGQTKAKKFYTTVFPDYMEEVGFPPNFKITDGYDFGASGGYLLAPGLTNVDNAYGGYDPDDHPGTINANLDEPVQLPPKPFISLKDITPYLHNEEVVIDNIDHALLPGGTVFISSTHEAVDPYVDLLTAKGYQQVSDISTEPFSDGDYDRSIILRKSGELPKESLKLIMKKTALEIGGETFPDALKFKDPISEFNIERTIGEIYQKAETFVVGYIWAGLQDHGIVGPDDANVIQEDADRLRFNSASSLVHQLMEEGWFKYLEFAQDTNLKDDPELQQSVFNSIQNSIEEGAV